MENNENFRCNHTSNFPSILKNLNASILISTYQSKKLITLSERENKLDANFIEFDRPMGMYTADNKIWAGFGHTIWEFTNLENAVSKIDEKKVYDACYLPMNINITGSIDIHEMEYCQDNLYFINTSFSCLCIADHSNSFKPIWKPPFISLLQPLDKCHLNGFCTRDNEPRYVTLLGQSDQALGWREKKVNGGMLMDITNNEILATNLSMPHSPRWYKNKLWFLESGKGLLSYLDLDAKKITEVAKVPGFTRGIQFVGDFAFIGLSKIRESAMFSGLEITKLNKRVCGVWVVNIVSGETVSFVEFTQGIDEIFSVCIVPHKNPKILHHSHDLSKINYLVSNEDLASVQMPSEDIELAAPLFEKGMDLFNENKKIEAIEQFKKALDIQADYLPATLNIAIALGDLGEFEKAKELLFNVIENDASIEEAYNSLGYLYFKQNDKVNAKKYFSKALEVNPNYEQAKISLNVLKEQYGVQ